MLLSELGERKITELLLPEFCPDAGDDCAYFALGDQDIVVTTDPVPVPAAKVIANDPDLYWAGRLLVTINASDLAASGARPLVFVTSVECPSDLDMGTLKRFFEGVVDACAYEGLRYSGGNLKESPSFAATGTAIGVVPKGHGLHRKGANCGDVLFSVGRGGEFWRDAFAVRSGEAIEKSKSKLFAPSSQSRYMQSLRESVTISVSMDNSDGLLATLDQLARINGRQILLDLEKLSVPDTSVSAAEQARLWLGWGDWNVIIATPKDEVEYLRETALKKDIPLFEIGYFTDGASGLMVSRSGKTIEPPRLESERFALDSWFSEGIEGYISRLKSLELP